MNINQVKDIASRITMNCLGKEMNLRIDKDNFGTRLFLQVIYTAPCTKTGDIKQYKGRKWYLSSFMCEDEVIKTAYAAFEACVKHEVMEGFKVDGVILFNPHVNYRELLGISNNEVNRS